MFVEQASDVDLDDHTLEHHHHHLLLLQQQQQQACNSSRDDRATSDPQTGSVVTAAGTRRLVSHTLSDCALSLSSSTGVTATTDVSAVSTAATLYCSLRPANISSPLYPVYPPYIVMGISVQPFTYPPHHLDATSRPVTGSRKRRGNKLLPPESKGRADRKQKRLQHGDVVSSTTPDYSLPKTTSGHHICPFPPETTSSAAQEAEVTSPVCLVINRDKLVYDSCGALDLTVRK